MPSRRSLAVCCALLVSVAQMTMLSLAQTPTTTPAIKSTSRYLDQADGMTADAVLMDRDMLERLTRKLLDMPEIAAVFYDLTHKPPGTIECGELQASEDVP